MTSLKNKKQKNPTKNKRNTTVNHRDQLKQQCENILSMEFTSPCLVNLQRVVLVSRMELYLPSGFYIGLLLLLLLTNVC